jgi:glycogen operon protein
LGRDGSDTNYSENCGVEGPSDNPDIEALRKRLIKNFLLTLFISRGIPMLLGGDEFRRTQKGNNNAYCQDNSVSWFDWSFVERHREIHRFARGMIAFRRAHSMLRKETFYSDADVTWVGLHGGAPEWSNAAESAFACLILGYSEPDLFLVFNAGGEAVTFPLPAAKDGAIWHLAADTSHLLPTTFTKSDANRPCKTNVFFARHRDRVQFSSGTRNGMLKPREHGS